MNKVVIVTDSNSGIRQEKARELGIRVVPMPFYIDGEMYYEDITLTQEEFYTKLREDADITTSQPSPADVQELWDELLQEYDEVVHIPMSSGLSGSCETAMMLAKDYDGKVHVVNNQRISVTQKQSVLDALELAKTGRNGQEIKDVLEADKFESTIYITLETLKYLKKGGRITPAAAAMGTILNIKPVLQIQGEKLDAYSKSRGFKAAKKIMIEAMQKDMKTCFKESASRGEMLLQYAYTCSKEEAAEWQKELEETFPGYAIEGDPLSLSVACHIGEGALAIACTKKTV